MKIIPTLLLGLTVFTAIKPIRADVASEIEVFRGIAPQPAGSVIFLGSSSIAIWNDEYDLGANISHSHPEFAGIPSFSVLSRGIRSSRIADTTREAKMLVHDNKPKAIVFYAGENDITGEVTIDNPDVAITSGAKPEDVKADFLAFITEMRSPAGGLGNIPIAFISIKPSPEFFYKAKNTSYEEKKKEEASKRWKENAMQANTLIYRYIKAQPATKRLRYIDVWRPMTDREGNPLRQYFKPGDLMHMGASGYLLWASITRPYVRGMLANLASDS